ncbi:MAG: hypothetical protein JO222_04360 [Frankiales bacterium]|nr:hypothetical protein [Frankiales bacterium]
MFLLTRVPVLIGIIIASMRPPNPNVAMLTPVRRVAERDDGFWYLHIAAHGYGRTLHGGVPEAHLKYSPWAFFPGWPMLLRGVHAVVPLRYPVLSLVVASVVGLGAVVAVYALAATYAGHDVARGATLLFAAWPASGLLDMPYSEGLFIAAAAASLALLHRRQWWWAGLAGAVATVTRPTGLAVVAAAAVAAVLEIRRRRSVVPLVAPLLAMTGMAGFLYYSWVRTGDALIWRRAENLWRQQLNFDVTLPHNWIRDFQAGGYHEARGIVQICGAIVLIAILVLVVRHRRELDWPLLAYLIVGLSFILGYSGVGPRPRFLFVLLPCFVWAAQWLSRRTTQVVAAISSLLLGVLTFLYLFAVVP